MQAPTNPIPVRIPRPEHTLSRSCISQGALTVLYQLHNAGYQAFLIGGGVRDVLLGLSPKDFDVVTNAHPEQIKTLFPRQCHLIGRRFVLAHVRVNKEIIEVSTFRAHSNNGEDGVVIEDGRIVRDNAYGTIDEDVWRRDFTINALYYNISDFSVLDYANGMADLRAGIIRLIGDPLLRYREDPVRMLRAVRFVAKLGFTMAPSTLEPIQGLAGLLVNIPPARLYEEVLKLFFSGHALKSFTQLCQHNLFKYLFPYTQSCFNDPHAQLLVEHALSSTDERIAEDKPAAPAFLLAVLLWPPISHLLPKKPAKGFSHSDLLLEESQQVLAKQMRHVFIPRRVTIVMQEIWILHLRLIKHSKNKKILSTLAHPRFRAAYDFLLLRAKVDESLKKIADWWTQFQESDEKSQQQLLSQRSFHFQRSRRYRRAKEHKKT